MFREKVIFGRAEKHTPMKKLLIFFTLLLSAGMAFSQNSWTQKGDFAGGKRYGCFTVVIGNKAYVGQGTNGVTAFADWWEYTPATDSWTQRADFPGVARYVGGAVSINGKGYIGLGSSFNYDKLKDWWEYDPAADTWTKKQQFPSAGRFGVASFTVNNKGYICFGNKGNALGPLSKQLWEYDPVTDSWASKSPFPGHARYGSYAFSIGDKGYAGLGGKKDNQGNYKFYDDFWEYNPSIDMWTQKANYPERRSYPVGFVLNDLGYVGLGNNNGTVNSKFYAYDPVLDSWSYQTTLPANSRSVGIGFALNEKAYVGLGENFTTATFFKDIWEYVPNQRFASNVADQHETSTCAATFTVNDHILLPHLQEGVNAVRFRMFDVSGKLVESRLIVDSAPVYLDSHMSPGIYLITVAADEYNSCTQKIAIR